MRNDAEAHCEPELAYERGQRPLEPINKQNAVITDDETKSKLRVKNDRNFGRCLDD